MSEQERPSPVLTYVGDEPVVTLTEVAQSIGWMNAFGGDGLEFDTVHWGGVEKDGVVYLEGRKGKLAVSATVQIVEVYATPSFDDEDYDDEDDDD